MRYYYSKIYNNLVIYMYVCDLQNKGEILNKKEIIFDFI